MDTKVGVFLPSCLLVLIPIHACSITPSVQQQQKNSPLHSVHFVQVKQANTPLHSFSCSVLFLIDEYRTIAGCKIRIIKLVISFSPFPFDAHRTCFLDCVFFASTKISVCDVSNLSDPLITTLRMMMRMK